VAFLVAFFAILKSFVYFVLRNVVFICISLYHLMDDFHDCMYICKTS